MEYNITYRQKDKGWQYIISYKDESGKWRQRAKQGFRTKSLAKIAADKRLEEMKKNFQLAKKLSIEDKGITFKKLANKFVDHEELYKAHNTIISYESGLEHFSKINNKAVNEITTLDIQGCVDEMVRKGFATSTIKLYVGRVKTIFENAVEPYKIILENPVQNIKYPIEKTNNNDKIKALSETELANLLKKLPKYATPQEYIASVIAAKCGLRLGEIMGLTWDRIDEINSVIIVDKQWKRLKDGDGSKMDFGSLKSKNSYRKIPVSPLVLAEIQEYKRNNPTDLDNRVLIYKNNSSLNHTAKKYRKAGYDISIHDLRHTYATTLIANGLDFKTVAKLMGHDVEETIRTYSHVTSDMMERAANVINSIF